MGVDAREKRISGVRTKFRDYYKDMYAASELRPAVVSMIEDAVVAAEMLDRTNLSQAVVRIDRLAKKNIFMKDEAAENGMLMLKMISIKAELENPMDGLPAYSPQKIAEITERKIRAEIAKRLVRKELARKWCYHEGRMQGFDGIPEVFDAGNIAYGAINYDFTSPETETQTDK